MTQDVRPWLSEIQELQEKLAAAHQERDEAYASAANWRRLYDIEANQRRTEVTLAQQTIDTLKAKLQQMPFPSATEADDAAMVEQLQQEIEPLQRPDDLKSALLKALMECDRIARLLQSEQAAHAQTRKTLTAALGDTVEMLSQERAVRHLQSAVSASGPVTSIDRSTNEMAYRPSTSTAPTDSTAPTEPRTPLLELPPIESVQSRF